MRLGLVMLGSLFITACGGAGYSGTSTGPVGPPVITTSVEMRNTAFNPGVIQVSPGATVTFTNNDGFNHNVTFGSAAITSIGEFATGSRTAVMPATAGTYSYQCTIHPGMTGSINVQ
jgi:plastocyanin